MKTLTIRNVSEDLYQALIKLSKSEGRSLQEQTLKVLEYAKFLSNSSSLETAKNIRKSLEGRKLGNSMKEIRSERSK
jgi:hypothetical protein